jgi:hypothetical protein
MQNYAQSQGFITCEKGHGERCSAFLKLWGGVTHSENQDPLSLGHFWGKSLLGASREGSRGWGRWTGEGPWL